MSRKRIATFVHISDLHVGEIDHTTGNARLDPHGEDWLRRYHWFDGYLGHSGTALRHLDRFFRGMRRDEQADLIVTGDLTALGSMSEFRLARSYLSSRNPLHNGSHIGLNVSDALQRSVLGNHDHWSGRRPQSSWDPVMLGTPGFGRSSMPWTGPSVFYQLLAPDIQLALIRVDSDADATSRMNRLLGRGVFASQLNHQNAVPVPPPTGVRQIRVMLLHHSLSSTSVRLGMCARTRSALHQFLTQNDIRLILTGHLHTGRGGSFVIHHPGAMEARCGSSTQRDTLPPGWRPLGHPMESNTLLVHRLFEETSGALTWEIERYERTTLGFGPCTSQPPPGAWGTASQQLFP